MSSAEEERRRLAAEIHDGPVQSLTAIGLRLDAIAVRLHSHRSDSPDGSAPGAFTGDLESVRVDLASILQDTRDIVAGLGPEVLHGAGLEKATAFLCQKTASRSGLDVNLDVGRLDGVPRTVEAMLYRILQEALANATRHARATRIDVFMGRRGRDVVLEVADDGKTRLDLAAVDFGSLVEEGHYGLAFMQERVRVVGGSLEVGTSASGGTRLAVSIPDVVEVGG
jgi:two-component system NarL family sensor kinase